MSERIHVLDHLGAEFARVAADAEETSRRPGRSVGRVRATRLGTFRLGIVLAIAVLLVACTYAVPVTRAAVEGVVDSFAAWVSNDTDDPPGRELAPRDDVPKWFRDGGETRLIAETGGVSLYVRKADSPEGPWLWFGLGEGVPRATGDSLERWRERLHQRAMVVLGPALFGPRDVLDERARFPLIGLVTRDVARLQLRYHDGPPQMAEAGDGGFVLLADAWRRVRELIAYDQAGHVVERLDMRRDDMRYLCEKEPEVCPPGVAADLYSDAQVREFREAHPGDDAMPRTFGIAFRGNAIIGRAWSPRVEAVAVLLADGRREPLPLDGERRFVFEIQPGTKPNAVLALDGRGEVLDSAPIPSAMGGSGPG
jgi:hypothetical protein